MLFATACEVRQMGSPSSVPRLLRAISWMIFFRKDEFISLRLVGADAVVDASVGRALILAAEFRALRPESRQVATCIFQPSRFRRLDGKLPRYFVFRSLFDIQAWWHHFSFVGWF